VSEALTINPMKTKLAGIVGGALCAMATFAFDAQTAESNAQATVGGSADVSADASLKAPAIPESDSADRGLWQQSTMNGSAGLIRTVAADSGAAGTFRLGVLASYFSGSGFLCPPCQLPDYSLREPITDEDDANQVAQRVLLSVTPLEFLEVYGALHSQSTSNSEGVPNNPANSRGTFSRNIQVVGNTTLGVKFFTPTGPDRIFSFGGAVDMEMLSSAGSVGIHTANVGIRALGTLDFTRRKFAPSRVPLRLHLNAGYLFDQSGTLADDIEAARNTTLGHQQSRITRIERFAHAINRVDSIRTAIAVEGAWKWVRPFLEWSLDIPVNRQGHECGGFFKQPGDGCLSQDASFSAIPSRLTIGVRGYPWATPALEGLALLFGVDVGTGATGTFLEEVTPERPWAIHVGLAYAVDTAGRRGPSEPPKVVEKLVPAPPPPERYIEGVVTVAGKEEPVPGAVVRYQGRSLTGMVADDQGKFRTQNLDPGEYRFTVSADGYKDVDCAGVIPAPETPTEKADTKKDAKGGPLAPAPAPAAPATAAPVIAHVTCALEPLPKTATITGIARDAETTEFIGGAKVTITDPLGRALSLQTDGEGAFRFGNVVAGKSALAVEADGYLRGSVEVTVEPRRDVSTQVLLYKRPKTPNVVVTATEIKLKKEVHFLHGSAEILPDSMAILEEAADVLRSKPDLANIEIQGHTDDSGTPEYNLKLSTDRANAVKDVFVRNGVEASRLSAHGYGQDKPLVPNTSPKNRAKNRRVQLVIVK
jgi:outer membrane protein OmpA-like peptidoglycan-associated protein